MSHGFSRVLTLKPVPRHPWDVSSSSLAAVKSPNRSPHASSTGLTPSPGRLFASPMTSSPSWVSAHPASQRCLVFLKSRRLLARGASRSVAPMEVPGSVNGSLIFRPSVKRGVFLTEDPPQGRRVENPSSPVAGQTLCGSLGQPPPAGVSGETSSVLRVRSCGETPLSSVHPNRDRNSFERKEKRLMTPEDILIHRFGSVEDP